MAAVVLTTLHRGNRAPFADSIVAVAVPPIARPEATMALMTGVEPMGFVIPSFPAQIPFLRVDGYLVGPDRETAYLTRMTTRIGAHLKSGGDLFTLYLPSEQARGDRALAQLGLKRTEDCATVTSNLAPALSWCRVVPGAAP